MTRDEERIVDSEYSDDDEDSTSESVDHRMREKKKKKRSKSSHRDDRRHGNDRKSSAKDKKKKEKKKSKKKKDRKRKEGSSSSESDSYHSEEVDDVDSYKRRRKDRKRRKRSIDDNVNVDSIEDGANKFDNRNRTIIRALHDLLQDHPNFAADLPLILIRLAGGTMFDLTQMTDAAVAHALQTVFESLDGFGVTQHEENGMWLLKNPPGTNRRDELVLLRVIRALLDEAGISIDKIGQFEQNEESRRSEDRNSIGRATPAGEEAQNGRLSLDNHAVKESTFQLLVKFQSNDAELGLQLAGLCQTIAEGESVSIDGLPNGRLKEALESLFLECGLEKSEMEHDESDEEEEGDDGDDKTPLFGYGVPDSADRLEVQGNLAAVMAACREGPPKRRALGPSRMPTEAELAAAAFQKEVDEDEEDGPMLPGAALKRRQGPTLPLELIKAEAEHRELELKATAAGVPLPSMEGGREEWMIIPGKYDFLEGIKSGNPMKSRTFKNKKSRADEEADVPIHPAMQAELDAIIEAHQDARGPSLMDQHRAAKQREKEAAEANRAGKAADWKWSRDQDLDAGRRVDKDALGMILGGAADNLKTKFQGGFNR
jgi:hypothetical protein